MKSFVVVIYSNLILNNPIMKKLILNKPLAFSLGLIAFAFTGCNLFDKADDVTFTTTLDQTFNIDEEAEATDKAYSQELVVDATTDPQINKYKNKIKSFTVNKVTYKVTNYSGGAITFNNGSLSFSSSDASSATVAATLASLDLEEAYNNGTEYELTLSADAITKIQSYLKANKAVKVYLAGTLSQTPVSFDVEVKIDVKVESAVL
jgi:hypothetical protein